MEAAESGDLTLLSSAHDLTTFIPMAGFDAKTAHGKHHGNLDKTPTTVANAAGLVGPKRVIATATASSKSACANKRARCRNVMRDFKEPA